MTHLIDVRSSLVSVAGETAAKFEQQVPQWYLDDLKDRRNASDAAPTGELLHAASIPVVVYEKWRREGFDILKDQNISWAEIRARLVKDGLDAFILTNRSL